MKFGAMKMLVRGPGEVHRDSNRIDVRFSADHSAVGDLRRNHDAYLHFLTDTGLPDVWVVEPQVHYFDIKPLKDTSCLSGAPRGFSRLRDSSLQELALQRIQGVLVA
jgi:hypothetical protein